MEKKDIKKLVILFVVVLLIGMGLDFSRTKDIQEGIIHRQDIGEESTEENMVVTIEGIEGSLEYVIDVEAMRPTREQAEKYFEDAIVEMEQEFELLNFEEAVSLPFREHYVDGIVSAEWNVDPWEAVNVVDRAPVIREPCKAPAAPASDCIWETCTGCPNMFLRPSRDHSSVYSAIVEEGVMG